MGDTIRTLLSSPNWNRCWGRRRFELLRECEIEIEWAREDALSHLDAIALQVLNQILCVDEQNRVKAGSDNEEEGKSSTILHHVASSSSPGGGLRATTPPPASLRATAQLDPARLKPGCKVSATSKYKLTKPHGDDYGKDPNPNPKQRVQSWFGLARQLRQMIEARWVSGGRERA